MDLPENIPFEAAFSRLEEILEKMNGGALSLEDSLHLYEEADKLIQICNKKLSQAETKIEMLVKNREGEAPSLQPFPSSFSNGLA
jgi:exodeoxyribonuclease VII small subunit